MKAKVLGLVLAVCGGMNLWAEAATATTAVPATKSSAPAQEERWDACLGGFWFGVPASITDANVSGLKLGLPISSGKGKTIGAELGLFATTSDNIKGFQWAMAGAAVTKQLSGFQMGLVSVVDKEICGAQMSLVNVVDKRGVQIGIVNYADNADAQFGLVNFNRNGWMPFMVFFNHGK